jgi:putative ABC transport system permease protein
MLKFGVRLLEEFLQDLRHATRILWKRPGFSLICALTIALGIGANTAIFSVLNATLLRPLPYQQSEQLLMVWGTNPGGFGWRGKTGFSAPSFFDYQNQNHTFERMATFTSTDFTLVGNESAERIRAGVAGDGFFDVLKVQPILGRVVTTEDCRTGQGHVVVLSYRLWQQRFGSDRNIVGQKIQLDATPYVVIGVLPKTFDFSIPEYFESKGVWVPAVEAKYDSDRGHKYLSVIGRLKPGVTLGQAEQDMKLIAERLAKEYPHEMATLGVKLTSLQEVIVGDVRGALWLLFGAVGFVLFIACANVANLQLSRASTRQKEIAIRRALGATRGRLLRALLTESLLLSLVGGLLGLLIAFWGIRLIIGLGPTLPQAINATVDLTVPGYCLLLSLVTGILSGLAPALQTTSFRYDESLKDGTKNSASPTGGLRLRKILTVSEVALSLMLLIGAGLLIRSFVELLRVNPGFNSENILTARVYLPKYSYPDAARQVSFYRQVMERIQRLPGAIAVAASDELPPTKGSHTTSFSIEGHDPVDISNQSLAVEHRLVSADYFRAMGIPVISGRAFFGSDDASAVPVALVNQSFARRFFPNENALGQHLRFDSTPPWITIVGVVGDVHGYGLDKAAKSEIYLPYQQQKFLSYNPLARMYLIVHTSGNPGDFAPAMLDSIREFDKGAPTPQTRTMETVLASSIAERRSSMLLLGIFALVALLLTAVGIYGVISYAVVQRTQEIGIRMALGARTGDVLELIIRQGMGLVLIGLCLGLFGAIVLTRVLSTLLFGVGAKDPVTFVVVAVLLSMVAFVACYIPARRATRVDPLLALRCE